MPNCRHPAILSLDGPAQCCVLNMPRLIRRFGIMSQQTDDRPFGPSAQERRLALAAQIAASGTALDSGWPALDASLLENRRAPVPSFPLELLPACWRDWVNDTASSVGAPVDYVA